MPTLSPISTVSTFRHLLWLLLIPALMVCILLIKYRSKLFNCKKRNQGETVPTDEEMEPFTRDDGTQQPFRLCLASA